jgi:hypothetical protein
MRRERISLARCTFGEGGCSMNTTLSGSGRIDDIKGHPQGGIRGLTKLVKITEDVRKYAAEHGLTSDAAIESGLREKAKEFAKNGAEVYAKT